MNLDELEGLPATLRHGVYMTPDGYVNQDQTAEKMSDAADAIDAILSRLRAAEKLRKSLDGQAYDDEIEKAIAEYDRSKT